MDRQPVDIVLKPRVLTAIANITFKESEGYLI